MNTCQGLDSVHYAVDNSRAYGAIRVCLLPCSKNRGSVFISRLVIQTVMILRFVCKTGKKCIVLTQISPKHMLLHSRGNSLYGDEYTFNTLTF